MVADNFEIKDMSGSLFRANDKPSDKHPDYTGKAKINGSLLRVSAWLKESKSGTKYLSLAFSEPREQAPSSNDKPAAKPNSFADMKEDLPF